MPRPDHLVGKFDLSHPTCRTKQRRTVTSFHLAAQRRKAGRIIGKGTGRLDVCNSILNDQFWHPMRLQQAGGHPRHHLVSGHRQQGQSRCERLYASRMGVATKGVEEEVGARKARQMLFVRHLAREDQTLRVDSGTCRLRTKVGCRQPCIVIEPKHGIRLTPQYFHPAGKRFRIDLPWGVEATIDEAVVGQAMLRAF